jgi:hypothetical protein
MARRAFYSFHYKPDNWRVSQVRNIGAVEGNAPASDNDWETVTKEGDEAIKRWINNQLSGRGCTIVLIGAATAGRKWINYEIEKSWNDAKGVLGVHIHNLKDVSGNQSTKGSNPFSGISVGNVSLSSIVNAYDPPYYASKDVYAYIENNLESWIEAAIKIRGEH